MCLESLNFGNSYIVTTPCGHLFHQDCLKQWLYKSKKTCPKCRAEIPRKKRDTNKLTRIYLSPASDTCFTNIQNHPPNPKRKNISKNLPNSNLINSNVTRSKPKKNNVQQPVKSRQDSVICLVEFPLQGRRIQGHPGQTGQN